MQYRICNLLDGGGALVMILYPNRVAEITFLTNSDLN